jgi:hypothetical protein
MVRRFQSDAHLGALTGNPRLRKSRYSLLGRLQGASSPRSSAMVKRAQTVYGTLFTVSGGDLRVSLARAARCGLVVAAALTTTLM